jgi:putative membrane protein
MRIVRVATALACFSTAPALAQDNPQPGGAPLVPGPDTGLRPDKPSQNGEPSEMTTGQKPEQKTEKVAKLDKYDRDFFDSATVGSLFQVKAGQLAVDKATSPTVKQFAQKMVDDHGKVNDQLKKLGEQKGLTIPDKLDAKRQADYDRLDKLSGEEFDREYMKLMVDEHSAEASAFQREADSSKDADLKSFARQTLPTLKQHIDQARHDQHGM